MQTFFLFNVLNIF